MLREQCKLYMNFTFAVQLLLLIVGQHGDPFMQIVTTHMPNAYTEAIKASLLYFGSDVFSSFQLFLLEYDLGLRSKYLY